MNKDEAPFFNIKNQETADPKMSVTVGNEYVKNPGSLPSGVGQFKAYYGNQSVPHPTNSAAKRTPQKEAMRMVREGK